MANKSHIIHEKVFVRVPGEGRIYKAKMDKPAKRAPMGERASWMAPLVLEDAGAVPVLVPVRVVPEPEVEADEAAARVEVTTAEVWTREAVAVPSSTLM